MVHFATKVVVITGASSGIGKALALGIVAQSVHLILAARSMDELKTLQNACKQKGADQVV